MRKPTLADLVPDPHNRRKHNPRNVDMIAASLRSIGAARSIVIDEDNEILAGNGVVEAAAGAGLTKLQVVEATGDTIIAVRRTGLTAAQKRDLAIYDNRSAELAEWHVEQLAADLKNGEDLAAFFLPGELDTLFGTVLKPGHTYADDVPAERPTDIQPGDLFELGPHRLLCGDCTVAGDVARLMGEARAGLMNTDPPYGIAFDNAALGPTRKKYADISNDELHGDHLQAFLELAFQVATTAALGHTAAWYLWHAHVTQGVFAAAATAAHVVLHRQIIWVKPRLILGRGHYHWKHEPCFMGWIEGHRPPDYGLGNGERTQTTVWEIDGVTKAERDEFDHATPKPVGLFTIPIVKHLKAGEVAYEPFAGTGPQFIAAEQLGRRCFGIEIAPGHCQVDIDRWEAFTGQQAVKVGEAIRA